MIPFTGNAGVNPPAAGRPPGRLAELDGIRGIAALSVVFAHYTPAHPADPRTTYLFPLLHDVSLANIAVAVFFGLSAFLLAGNAQRRFNAGMFVVSRILRILPLYTVVVLVTVVTVGQMKHPEAEMQEALDSFWAYVLFWFNWLLALGEHGYLNELNHLWSLSVEMQFYAVLALLFSYVRNARAVTFLAAILIAGLALRVLFLLIVPAGQLYYASLSYLEVFGFCGAAGVAHARGVSLPRWTLAIPVASLFALGYVWQLVLWQQSTLGLLIYSMLGPLTAALLVSAVQAGGIVSRVLGSLPLRWLGAISYGLYMWHLPIKFFISPLDDGPATLATRSRCFSCTSLPASSHRGGLTR